jgi:hypothetical protein
MKLKPLLKESSLSRVWGHIKGDRSFAVVSAFRGEFTPVENEHRHAELKKMVRGMGLGFIEQKSGYTYTSPDTGEEGRVEEKSVFIPNCNLKQALQLGKHFRQESVIYKDANRFDLIDTSGSVIMRFSRKDEDGVITFDPSVLKYAYSQFIKGNQSAKSPYAFRALEEVYELCPPGMTAAYRAMGTGKLPEAVWKKIPL